MDISLEECKKYQGYLQKKSPSLFGGWQKRFFKVLDGKVIVYFEKENDQKAKGTIKLDEISNPEATEDKVFKFTLEQRDFILKAESNEERDNWVQVITKLKEEFNRRNVRMSVYVKAEQKEDPELKIRVRGSTVKANKIQALDKDTMELLHSHGLQTTEDANLSIKLLSAKGIDKLINLKDPKILSRIHHGFLFKHHKSHDYFQKRWFFIYSHRPLKDENYEKDELNIDKKKEWLEFDSLFYFKYEGENVNSGFQAKLDLSLSHKIEIMDKEEKFYLVLDVEDRRYEFYSESNGERDFWFEILKNARRTAKEYAASITKHPRNIELLNKKYLKSPEEFNKKLEEEKNQCIGDYKEIKEYNIFDFALTNFENQIESTIDGCNANTPPKSELLQAYAEHMNAHYLIVVQTFWENQFNNIDSSDIMKIAMRIFQFSQRLKDVHLIDPNLEKNAREFVKIYMKKIFKNTLDVIENILKSEREVKAIKNSEGQYSTNGPSDLFDILSKTFDLVKEHKNKYIYEQTFNLFHECIIQYLIGVDCVTSNFKIKVETEFLLAVANNSAILIQLLNQLIDDTNETGVLNEKEINEAICLKQINTSINLMTKNSIERFVNDFSDELSTAYEGSNFLEIDITKALLKTNDLFGKYNPVMNKMIIKKCWEVILKNNVFFYIKSLLTTAHKKVKNKEDLIKKIEYDKGLLSETFEPVVGPNLTQANLKILSDIKDFLEISSYMISSSCLTLREYIGPSFSISTAKAIINLRCDFTSDEKKDAIAQCKDVLENYSDKGKGGIGGFFDKMEEEIKIENEDPNEAEFENIENEEKEKEQQTVGYSLDDFLKENDEEEEIVEEEKEEDNIMIKKEEVDEISDIAYEGVMKKKSHTNWQERFFQLKNGYLYWFKDKEASIIQNKLSIKNTLRVESHKDKKFMMVIANDEKDNNNGKVYKFACNSEEEKEGWINAITNEMKRLRGEQKSSENKIEIKQKKKVIFDKFNLPDVGKDRSYMKTRTEALMKDETFFLPLDPKEKKAKKKKDNKEQINTSTNISNSQPKIDINISSNQNQNLPRTESSQVQQFNVQERGNEDGGAFSCCRKIFCCCFKSNNNNTGVREQLNQ